MNNQVYEKVHWKTVEIFLKVSFNDDLRLGQRFLNNFFTGLVDPELFYESNINEAINMIASRYTDWSGFEGLRPF